MFRENNIDFESVNYFNEPIDKKKLRELLKKSGLNAADVLRKGDKVYKELNLGEETDQDRMIELIVEYPNLLQRPIVEVGDKAVMARPIEKALELIDR